MGFSVITSDFLFAVFPEQAEHILRATEKKVKFEQVRNSAVLPQDATVLPEAVRAPNLADDHLPRSAGSRLGSTGAENHSTRKVEGPLVEGPRRSKAGRVALDRSLETLTKMKSRRYRWIKVVSSLPRPKISKKSLY